MRTDISIRVAGHAVDPEAQGRVVGVVQPGDLDHGTGTTLAVAADLDLGTFVVELGVAVLGAVQGDVLDADEVLAGRGVVGDAEGDGGLVPCAPVLVVLFSMSGGRKRDRLWN